MKNLHITFIGLTITSPWGSGHATTYRGLVRELSVLGRQVSFLEKDTPWYRSHHDLPFPEYCKTGLYENLRDLIRRYISWILRHHTAAVRARELLQHVAALTCNGAAVSRTDAGADIPEQIQ